MPQITKISTTNVKLLLEAPLVKNNYTWSRPSRKMYSTNAVLPGLDVNNELNICIGIDTSGSISESMLRDFLSEINGNFFLVKSLIKWVRNCWRKFRILNSHAKGNERKALPRALGRVS